MTSFISRLFLITLLVFTPFASQAVSKIHFGMIYFYPPFAFSTREGDVRGFDVDLVKAICQRLNASCNFTVMPLDKLFLSLSENQVDAIVGAISITPSRQQVFDFTEPYFKSTMSFLSLAKRTVNLQNLQGERMGVTKDSIFIDYLKHKFGDKLKLVMYSSSEELINALPKRDVDVIAVDTPVALYWVNYSAGLFKVVGKPEFVPSDKGYAIVVKKGDKLVTKLNDALNLIRRDGTLDKLVKAHFPPQIADQADKAR